MRLRHLPCALVAAALSLACGVGGSSGPADTQSPLVRIDDPVQGAQVGRQVLIAVTAQDDIGVDRVRILIDSVLLVDLAFPPYRTIWNTNSVADSTDHIISAEARDAAGNKGLVTVTVHVVHELQ